jgi:hypothetical protein
MFRMTQFVGLLALVLFVGCGTAPDARPLSAAIGKLHTLADEILGAFEAGTPDAGHDALHGVGDLLKNLPTLGQQAGLSAENISVVSTASDTLMDEFGKLDATMHGDTTELDLPAIKTSIEAALASLEKVLPAGVTAATTSPNTPAATPAAEEHDHDHEEDHDHEAEAAK